MFHLSFFLHFWHLVYDNLRAEETYSGLEQMFMFPCILFPTVTKKMLRENRSNRGSMDVLRILRA